MSWAERQADEAEWERERLARLDAECNRLRKALETQAAAVRALESTRAARSAHDQRVLNSLEAKSRAELLEELDSLRAERDAFNAAATELRDILEGRTTPPTEAEMEAHEAAGGLWRRVSTMDGAVIRGSSADGEPWVYVDDPMYALPKRHGSFYATRYWALDSRGELTAWPKAKS